MLPDNPKPQPMSPRMRYQVATIQKYLTEEFKAMRVEVPRRQVYDMALAIWRITRSSA